MTNQELYTAVANKVRKLYERGIITESDSSAICVEIVDATYAMDMTFNVNWRDVNAAKTVAQLNCHIVCGSSVADMLRRSLINIKL